MIESLVHQPWPTDWSRIMERRCKSVEKYYRETGVVTNYILSLLRFFHRLLLYEIKVYLFHRLRTDIAQVGIHRGRKTLIGVHAQSAGGHVCVRKRANMVDHMAPLALPFTRGSQT